MKRQPNSFRKTPELLLAVLMMAGLVIFIEGCGSSSDSATDDSFRANSVDNVHAPELKAELTTYSGKIQGSSGQLIVSGKFGSLVSSLEISSQSVLVELTQGTLKVEQTFPIEKNGSGLYGFNIDQNNLPVKSIDLPSLQINDPISYRVLYKDIEISNGQFFISN